MYKRRCDFLLDFIFYSETMQTTDKKLRYPLGGDLYAYVNTRRRDGVKIHIRHFQLSMDTKGGVKPTTRGVKMDAKTLRRLFAMKKQLTEEFKLQTSKLNDKKTLKKKKDFHQTEAVPQTTTTTSCENKKKKKNKKKGQQERPQQSEAAPQTTTTTIAHEKKDEEEEEEEEERYPRQQRTWPVHLLEASQPHCDNINNYPAAFLDVGAVTPSYSYNST